MSARQDTPRQIVQARAVSVPPKQPDTAPPPISSHFAALLAKVKPA